MITAHPEREIFLRSQGPTLRQPLSEFLLIAFLYFLFLVALGLHCCTQAFSSCGEQGLPFVAVLRLLFAVASLVAEHRPQGEGTSVVVAPWF